MRLEQLDMSDRRQHRLILSALLLASLHMSGVTSQAQHSRLDAQKVVASSGTQNTRVGGTPADIQRPTDVLTPPNGIELHSSKGTVRITTVLAGVFRVQITREAKIAERQSWSVLPGSFNHARFVRHRVDTETVSFDSDGIQVQIDRKTMNIAVRDRGGRIITQDVPRRPVEFHGRSFRINKSMAENEHFFGLGDKSGPLDHRDQAFTMWNTDAYHWQESTDPLYKSAPFFLAMHDGLSYGIFLDNTWRSSFDFGKECRDAYSFGAEAGAIDYYIITGDEPKDIVRRYTALTGRPAMLPRWAFGFQQSRWSYYPESSVREIANHLRADRIPADVLYLDIDYQDRYRTFTVDRERFPHFEQLISDLRKQHFHTVAITDLHIANAPKGEYFVFDAGVAGDHFVRNPDGSLFSGDVWPGTASFPEFTQARTREWWGGCMQIST